MDRLLIDYLPPVTGETNEFTAVMEAEQPEIAAVHETADEVLNNQFVMDSTEIGVKRWERMLKITPRAADSLNARKVRVLARMNEYLPYTLKTLNRMLSALCGEGLFSVEVNNELYKLHAQLDGAADVGWHDVYALLERVAPENLDIFFDVALGNIETAQYHGCAVSFYVIFNFGEPKTEFININSASYCGSAVSLAASFDFSEQSGNINNYGGTHGTQNMPVHFNINLV